MRVLLLSVLCLLFLSCVPADGTSVLRRVRGSALGSSVLDVDVGVDAGTVNGAACELHPDLKGLSNVPMFKFIPEALTDLKTCAKSAQGVQECEQSNVRIACNMASRDKTNESKYKAAIRTQLAKPGCGYGKAAQDEAKTTQCA